jgi:hypothetical protein
VGVTLQSFTRGPTTPLQNTLRSGDPLKRPSPESVVYLVQEPSVPKHTGRKMDLTPLTWWGKVKILMERNQTASYNPPAALLQLQERLKDFDPDKDYVAVAGGDSLAVILVGAALAQGQHTFFHYLRFERTMLPGGGRDPASGSYTPIRVPLTSTEAQLSVVP